MNRKQRRASARSGAAAAFGSPAGATPGGEKIAKLLAAAVARHRAGSLVEAERQYRHILALAPGEAEAQSRLGAVLMAQGKTKQALPHLERAIALAPDRFEAQANLAQAYLAAGRDAQAVLAAQRALELQETALGRALFARCARNARLSADPNGRIRNAMLRALAEDWAPPRELTSACIDLIKLDVAVSACIDRVNSAWPVRLAAAELLGAPAMTALAQDGLACRLLTCDPVTDIGLERLFANVRRAMLAICTTQCEWDERLLDFFCAAARQCFLNDYVYALPEPEAQEALRLRSALSERIATGETVPALWPIAVGAYFPLHTIQAANSLCERSWPPSVEAVLVQQIEEPAEERRLAAGLPVLTDIEDEVSLAVRSQYEESPYPRWGKCGRPEAPIVRDAPQRQIPDVLIAGCGTGLSTVEFARQMRNARILAVDLSLASLSYAERMAQKLGLDDIEFGQADILKLGSIGRQFDFIDASGVLHHLADPWRGWRILLSLLRPGGAMQLGLYSELGRRNIVAARALIAARGYRPTLPDIRRCREHAIASDDPLLKSLVQSQDFFTGSECRDLLFHVQEVRTTLPEIKSFVTGNKLNFAGFNLEPATLQKFAARYPARAALTDLDCWHAFEAAAPATFAGMYRFQVQKPPAPPNAAPQPS